MRAPHGVGQLLWMEGVGHMPNLERVAEFNGALERFREGGGMRNGDRAGSNRAAD